MSQQHDIHHGDEHGSFKSYMIGFVLSVVLTIIPFWLVMGDVLSNRYIVIAIIFGLGAIQMMVHIYYFLHVTFSTQQGWIIMSLAFTVILVVIALSGSIWVMFHLEENMMPAHELIERAKALP